jgi:hypothetical protein
LQRKVFRAACVLSLLLSSRLAAQQVPPVSVRGSPETEPGVEELAEVLVAVRGARVKYFRDSTHFDACRFDATYHDDSIRVTAELLTYLAAKTGGEVRNACAPPGRAQSAPSVMLSQVRLTATTADVTLSRLVESEVVLENFTLFRSGRIWYVRKILIAPVGKV